MQRSINVLQPTLLIPMGSIPKKPFTKIIPKQTFKTFPQIEITIACFVNPRPSANCLKVIKTIKGIIEKPKRFK